MSDLDGILEKRQDERGLNASGSMSFREIVRWKVGTEGESVDLDPFVDVVGQLSGNV